MGKVGVGVHSCFLVDLEKDRVDVFCMVSSGKELMVEGGGEADVVSIVSVLLLVAVE